MTFVQPEMLLVEDALGVGQIDFVLGFLLPRQAQNPVEVIAGDGVFGRRRGHLLEPLQLLRGDFLGFGRHGGLLDFLAQRLDFAGVGIGFAQFALDGAHLFAQEEIALRFGDGSGDVGLDFGAERQHFVLAVEHRQEPGKPLLDGSGFEQLLPVLQAEVQVGGNQVGEVARGLRC